MSETRMQHELATLMAQSSALGGVELGRRVLNRLIALPRIYGSDIIAWDSAQVLDILQDEVNKLK